jgi:hypothetical protein
MNNTNVNNTNVNNTNVNKKTKSNYHFGVSNELIWSSHIFMGLFFVYIGYELVMHRKIPEYLALTIVVLGAMGGLYHTHLWYDHLFQ